jgi:hypothetical protein
MIGGKISTPDTPSAQGRQDWQQVKQHSPLARLSSSVTERCGVSKDLIRRLDSRVHGVAVGVGVGVGLGASTTLKFTVIGAPLVPVPPIKLHGVATKA